MSTKRPPDGGHAKAIGKLQQKLAASGDQQSAWFAVTLS
jgi:hypothetical protein